MYRLIRCVSVNVCGKVALSTLAAPQWSPVMSSVHLLHIPKGRCSIHRLERIIGQTLVDASEKPAILIAKGAIVCAAVLVPDGGRVGPVANLAAVIKDNDGNRNAEVHCVLIVRSRLTVNIVIDVSEVDDVRVRVIHGVRGGHFDRGAGDLEGEDAYSPGRRH